MSKLNAVLCSNGKLSFPTGIVGGHDSSENLNIRTKSKTKQTKTKTGTINILTLTGKCEELVHMMQRRKLHLLGLSETKWKGTGAKNLRDGYRLYWNGNKKESRNGVGFIQSKDVDAVTDITYIGERIIKAKVTTKNRTLTIIQVYAPQRGCTVQEKRESSWKIWRTK